MPMRAPGIVVLVFALAAMMSAQASEPGLSVSNAWMRVVLPSRPAAGYFTLSNAGDQERVLVGATSPACASLMLHRSLHEGGQERMIMVDKIPVPSGRTVKFAPGSYHLMCLSPSADVAPGRSIPVTLSFSDTGSMTVRFAVRGPTGR
jgi:copper(I)-binding protein